jgi:hypothetical protein
MTCWTPKDIATEVCVLWAEELGLHGANAARKGVGDRLGQNRWSARLKDGTTLTLKAFSKTNSSA